MKIKPFLMPVMLLAGAISAHSQTASRPAPKLVIGLVVDQMRYDYLYRYQASYGSGGFKRMLREGFSCENTHYNFLPTYTAPGHAAIYTGAFPALNGIIANEWWDPQWGRHRYVTADTAVRAVGASGRVGQHSPRVLLSTTITDELRLSNNFQSKVVGICLKDRASILPAGHLPNACYWFDDKSGQWITSSYYPDSMQLPAWVQAFNGRRLADQYLSKPWTKLPGQSYRESFAGWQKYEEAHYIDLPGDFPYDLPALKKKLGYGLLRFTPFGNSLTLDFAMEAIEQMQLGADDQTDFLCISFSATDYVGHQFGIHAEETQDTYLRLDTDLARLFDLLDKKFGRDNVLVFLTADHGGAETPVHLQDIGIPAGVFQEGNLDSLLENTLATTFGLKNQNFVLEASNQNIWFNRALLESRKIKVDSAALFVTRFLRQQPGVYDAFSREELMRLPADYPFAAELRRGIHPRRSGDVIFLLDPGWHPDNQLFAVGGTTHGSPYSYDTHVPLLWYGAGIRPGETFAPVNITDIAPTLAALLRIMEPSASMGKVIEEVMRR